MFSADRKEKPAIGSEVKRFTLSDFRGKEWSLIRILGPDAERWAADAAQESLNGLKPWQGKPLDAATGSFVRRQGAVHLLGFDVIGPTHEIANRWKSVVGIGDETNDHQTDLQSGSSLSFLTRSG